MKTLLLLTVLLALGGCKNEAPAVTPAPAATAAQPPPSPKGPETDHYAVAVAGRPPYAAGQASNAAITVTAKNGFHVNPEYPMAFKPEGHAGVQFPSERLKLAWGAQTACVDHPEFACSVEIPLPVSPEKPGPAVIAGIVAFSVCNPERCLIEKIPVRLAIDVQ